jgi:hypothetical protein
MSTQSVFCDFVRGCSVATLDLQSVLATTWEGAVKRFFVAVALSSAALAGQAQVRCKMPNGVWIEQKLATFCPAGAEQAQTLDGKPLPLRLPPPASAPAAGGEMPALAAMPSTGASGLESTRKAMDFDQCVATMLGMLGAVGGRNTRVIVASADLRIMRICTNDGSVLLTCNRLDRLMVTTKSPHLCE